MRTANPDKLRHEAVRMSRLQPTPVILLRGTAPPSRMHAVVVCVAA